MTGTPFRAQRFFHLLKGLFGHKMPAKRQTAPRLNLEPLEERALLSATNPLAGDAGGSFHPQISVLAAPSGQVASPSAIPASYGFSPSQVQKAYGFTQIPFLTSATNPNFYDQNAGKGETIAIVDAYNDPSIIRDANTFSTAAGLTPFNGAGDPTLTVLNQAGGTALPATDTGWATEIALDVEWAHAIAPQANIVLVEASSSSYNDLFTAVGTAASLAPVVSMSWGGGEFSAETTYDNTFARYPNVTFVVAAGDYGAPASYPATSPNVVAVGGTTLHLTTSNTRYSESGWGSGSNSWYYGGSGGGYSTVEAEPSYQMLSYTTHAASDGYRMSPDVSYDANPNTGFAVYDTTGAGGWAKVGGTSAGAPQWSALFALADQGRGSLGALGSSAALNALYTMAGQSYSTYFYDVTTGNNGYSAGKGYDLVTGLGSPQANNIVNFLVNNVAASSTGATAPATSGTSTQTTTPAIPLPPSSAQMADEGSELSGLLGQLGARLPQLEQTLGQVIDRIEQKIDPIAPRLGGLLEQLESKLQSLSSTPITDQDTDSSSTTSTASSASPANLFAEQQTDNATMLATMLQNSDAYLSALSAVAGNHHKNEI